MQVRVEIFTVNKRFPLTISRGTTAQTTNVWLRVEEDGIEGWGKRRLFRWEPSASTETIRNALQQVAPELQAFSPLERQQIELVLNEAQVPMHGRRWMWRYGGIGDTAVAFVGTGRQSHCANFGHNRD